MVPQARFLEMLIGEAERLSTFRKVMGARAEALLVDDSGQVEGIRYRERSGVREVRAQVVIGADGRFSRVRALADLDLFRAAPPFDLLWFRVPRQPSDPPGGVYFGPGGWLVLLNRGAEWQVAYSMPKGGYAALRAAGVHELRGSLGQLVPWLVGRADDLRDLNQCAPLVVEVSRVRQWYRPGLLLIGDAAHTMSPVAGVGISLAIQDAAVASNVLGARLRAGRVRVSDLAAVQRQREWPIRIVQAYQGLIQRWLIGARTGQVPHALRLHARIPITRQLAARTFGLGVWPVRLASFPRGSLTPQLQTHNRRAPL
jgi:2-polyprenyl-6-methoxyphenol hydroxylase-like FAD-dependent oxidoreductase